ncbi:MAG TPA: hypothetical protein VGM82_00065 [Gemmatimonadaceae bacterium]|jgi:hypothetical protein
MMRLRAALLVAFTCLVGTRLDAQCPSFYYFGTVEHVISSYNGHAYNWTFNLGYGWLDSPFQPPGYGIYDFGNLTSTDGKVTISNVQMITTCTTTVDPLGTTVWVTEEDWDYGTLTLHFTPPSEESDDCYWDEQHVGKRVPKPGLAKTDIDCTGGSGGGDGGGGGGSDEYCLYIDYYDLNGNYLYSDLVTCWYE